MEIRKISENELAAAAAVIRRGFGTVAEDFGLTDENCPGNGAFMTTELLVSESKKGKQMYGCYSGDIMVGFMQIEKKDESVYMLEKLAVLPEYRHSGFGGSLLSFARDEVKEMGGSKISIGIIEKNTVLKNWYASYGFRHTGTKKFDHLPFVSGFMELDV